MEGPLWVVLSLLIGIGLPASNIIYRYLNTKSIGAKMVQELRNQLHAVDTRLFKSLCISSEVDRIPGKKRWIQLNPFRPWLIVDRRQHVDEEEVESVLQDFVTSFQSTWGNKVPYVRTTIPKYTEDGEPKL